jgi:hypothetical protein
LVFVAATAVREAPAMRACHPSITETILRANLDRDRALEAVTTTNVSCAHERAFGIHDACHGERQYRLPGSGFRHELRVAEANGRADGREFFYILRQPETRAPELGTSALVHLVQRSPGTCGVPRLLFVYRSDDPPLPPPVGYTPTDFDVELLELSKRYRGLEVRLVELFGGRGPEMRRVTLLRYSRQGDRYVTYGRRSSST